MSLRLKPCEIVVHVGEGDLCAEFHHWPHRGETANQATTLCIKEIPSGEVGRQVTERERALAEPWSLLLHFTSKEALEVVQHWLQTLHENYPEAPEPKAEPVKKAKRSRKKSAQEEGAPPP